MSFKLPMSALTLLQNLFVGTCSGNTGGTVANTLKVSWVLRNTVMDSKVSPYKNN